MTFTEWWNWKRIKEWYPYRGSMDRKAPQRPGEQRTPSEAPKYL